MSLINIATEDLTLAHATGSGITGGSFTISSLADAKTKAGGSGVYTDPLIFTFSGGSATGFVAGTVATTAPVSMSATSEKTKASGALVMREGDSVLMNCTGTIPPPTGGTGPVAGDVEIKTAGQEKAKAQ